MSLSPGDVRRIHSSFGRTDELVVRRRAIYGLALALATGRDRPDDVADEVLDNPVTRAHLAEVLGGTADHDPRHVFSVDELAVTRPLGAAAVLRVAATPHAGRALQAALRRLGTGMTGAGAATEPALLLVDAESFGTAADTIADGVGMALDVAPELAADLLPHVALFAVVSARSAGLLGSASVREFPGLILLPEPRTASEVAEALVHEGAHQKFFDLAMTRRVLGDGPTVRFTPPWAPPGRPAWPFEQCVAAFHAYSCLAAFAGALGAAPPHADSLLPVADDRAAVLGDWLHGHGDHLGPDGRSLVGELTGRPLTAPAAPTDGADVLADIEAAPHRIATQEGDGWTLVMQWSRPATVVWRQTGGALVGR